MALRAACSRIKLKVTHTPLKRGSRRKGRPTRTDHFGLGQYVVFLKSRCCPRGQRLAAAMALRAARSGK